MRTDWAYVVFCLIAPLVWGIVSARVFDWVQAQRRRRLHSQPTDAAPFSAQNDDREMYYI